MTYHSDDEDIAHDADEQNNPENDWDEELGDILNQFFVLIWAQNGLVVLGGKVELMHSAAVLSQAIDLYK